MAIFDDQWQYPELSLIEAPMRTLSLSLAVALAVLVQSAEAQTVKRFKDWLVVCDNQRNCTAFGFENKDDANGAYVRIIRAGGSAAEPTVDINVSVDNDVKTPRVTLSLTGQQVGSVPSAALAAPYGKVSLGGVEVGDFLASLHTAKSLKIALLDGAKPLDSHEISLEGPMAALRFMDLTQKRDGGITALIAKGPAPAGDVPPLPPLSIVTAVKISQMADPLPKPPEGVHPSEDCMSGTGRDYALLAFRLDQNRTLWGACDAWGAYNQDYRFYVVNRGNMEKVLVSGYDMPGEKSRPDSAGILTSPSLARDNITIHSTMKEEGIGDCGIASGWVWDGQRLRLVELRAMPVCRGAAIDDWPLVFKAALR